MVKRSLAILFALLVALNTAAAVSADDDAGSVTDEQEVFLTEEAESLLAEEDTDDTEEVPSEEPVEEPLDDEKNGCTADVPEGSELLNTEDNIFGTNSWEDLVDSSYDKAFDGDISTYYDAYAATIDAHVGVDVGTATRLTEVHIVPRNANGYDPEVTVLEGSGGYVYEEDGWNELHDKLLDGDLDSVWCQDFNDDGSNYVIWQTSRPVSPVGYVMYTGYDTEEYPERNPISWTLFASNDPDGEWDVLDQQEGNYDIPAESIAAYEVMPENLPAEESYEYFKLQIDAGDDTIFQLSEFRLLEGPEDCIRMEGMTVQGSADGIRWADLYTFPGGQVYYAQPYVITADEMDYANDFSFTQFRLVNSRQHFNVAEVEFYGVEDDTLEAYPSAEGGEQLLTDNYADFFGADSWDENSIFTNAFDGYTDTWYDAYEGAGLDAYVGVKTGSPAKLTRIRIFPREDWTERMNNLTIQGSVNGNDWITLYQFPETDYGYEYYEVTEDMLASAAQHYAFTQFRVMNKADHLNVAEVEFYGTYDHDLEAFPIVIEEPIYSYITGEQFVNSAWVHYERDPDDPDDDHYLDWWYFNERDEEDGMTRFEREFDIADTAVLIGGVGFDNTVVELSKIDGKLIIAVAPWAFADENGIREVVVDEDSNCKYIMYAAFAECHSIETVTVSNSLRQVGYNAFNCPVREFIKEDASLSDEEKEARDWGYVEVIDGALISRGELIKYPPEADYVESYRVPDGVSHIANWAFAGADIGEITMGHNVLWIHYGAFVGSAAHTIKLSPSLEYLGNDAFMGCTNLTYVEIPSDDVEIDRWMDEDNDPTDDEFMFTPDMFADTVDYESEEPRADLVVRTYEGNMIHEYINYIQSLELEDYDMSHIKFEAETETYWYGGDWFGECGENEVFLLGYSAPLDAEITTFPTETYDGKTIIGIRTDGDAWQAFCGDDRVGGSDGIFTIPEGIRYIFSAPFADCNHLRTLVLPESLEYVEDAPFSWLLNLEKFVVAEGSKYFETHDDGATLYGKYYADDNYDADEFDLEAFALASGMTHVDVAEGTTVIRGAAFENSQTLRSVTLPDSLAAIDWWAFKNTTLESIEIPANVDRILPEAFMDCPNLTEVRINRLGGEFCRWEGEDFTTVFENSPNVTVYVYAGTDAHRAAEEYGWPYETVELEATVYDTYVANDGVHLAKVFAKSGDTYFTIPEEVQIIDERAFAGIEGIETVVFPPNLYRIDAEAFAGCGEDFEIITTGGVQIGWDDSAFDFDFGQVYNEQIFSNFIFQDSFLYRVTLQEGVNEAMLCGWWYDAIDAEGTLNVPETVEIDGVTYTVVSLQESALASYAPHDIVLGDAGIEVEDPDLWGIPTAIVLPETIRYIGGNAFRDLQYWDEEGNVCGLEYVYIPEGVQYIGNDAFRESECITEFDGLAAYGGDKGELEAPYQLKDNAIVNVRSGEYILMAYAPGRTDETYDVNGIHVIGKGAFRNAHSLKNITIDEGVYRIEEIAFEWCTGLETIEIPASVEEIHHDVFVGCDNLTDFIVADGNPNYFVEGTDGTLRCDDGETLVAYPLGRIEEGGVLEIPEVIGIRSGAAAGSDRIAEIIVPGSVRWIEDAAFRDNNNLKKVEIEGTLDDYTNLNILSWCNNLEQVVYYGDCLKLFHWDGDVVVIERDENGNDMWDSDGNPVLQQFELVLVNENCELEFNKVYDYDFENKDKWEPYEGDALTDNDYFYVTQISGPYYETYIAEDGVHLGRVFNVSGDITIPDEVMVIDDGVFEGIEGITSVTFPKNLRYIGHRAFADCDEEFAVHFTGAVQIDCEDDAFDFDFGAIYDEAFFWNQYWDGKFLYYLMPEANEAMLRGYWYTAIDENGVMEIPSEFEYDGETYYVTAIEPGSCEVWSADRLGDHVKNHSEEYGWVIEEREWTYDYPKSIIIPDTVRYIGDRAFQGHGYWNEENGDYGLESVTFPADILYIGNDVFWDCYQIKSFNGLDTFGESENPYQLYEGSVINTWGGEDVLMAYPAECGKTEYTVSGDIEIIGANAFHWAEELTALTLEEGVRVLREHAVILTNLETLTIPNSLEELHNQALGYNGNMKNFVVNNDHPWLEVYEDGTLRSDGGDTLIAYPTADIGDDRVLTIPDDVMGIGDIAFGGINLHKLIIPASVEWIRDGAFANNDDLKTVIIEGTLEAMNLNVFADCDNMETIIYYGDKIETFVYEGDEFILAHEFDNYGTPRKIDFIMPDSDDITFFVALNDDFNDRDYDTYTSDDNPYFNLLHELSEPVYGDTNGDGEVTEADALYLLRHTILPERYPLADGDHNYDADENGDITAKDAAALLTYVNSINQ